MFITTGQNEGWVTQQKYIATLGKVIQRVHLWRHVWSSGSGYVLVFRNHIDCVHICTQVLRVSEQSWWWCWHCSSRAPSHLLTGQSACILNSMLISPTALTSFRVGMLWCFRSDSSTAATMLLLSWPFLGGKQNYILNPSMLAYSNRHLSKWAFWRRLHRNVHNAGGPGQPCEFFF